MMQSYKTILFEYCQKLTLPSPTFTCQEEPPGFTCTMQFCDEIYLSSIFSRKKLCEHHCSYLAVVKLGIVDDNDKTFEESALKALPLSESIGLDKNSLASLESMNYKGQLLEYCQKNKIPFPSFEITEINDKYQAHVIFYEKQFSSSICTRKKLAEAHVCSLIMNYIMDPLLHTSLVFDVNSSSYHMNTSSSDDLSSIHSLTTRGNRTQNSYTSGIHVPAPHTQPPQSAINYSVHESHNLPIETSNLFQPTTSSTTAASHHSIHSSHSNQTMHLSAYSTNVRASSLPVAVPITSTNISSVLNAPTNKMTSQLPMSSSVSTSSSNVLNTPFYPTVQITQPTENYKGKLLEFFQKQHMILPIYEDIITQHGFQSQLNVFDRTFTSLPYPKKKQAEAHVSQIVLEFIQSEDYKQYIDKKVESDLYLYATQIQEQQKMKLPQHPNPNRIVSGSNDCNVDNNTMDIQPPPGLPIPTNISPLPTTASIPEILSPNSLNPSLNSMSSTTLSDPTKNYKVILLEYCQKHAIKPLPCFTIYPITGGFQGKIIFQDKEYISNICTRKKDCEVHLSYLIYMDLIATQEASLSVPTSSITVPSSSVAYFATAAAAVATSSGSTHISGYSDHPSNIFNTAATSTTINTSKSGLVRSANTSVYSGGGYDGNDMTNPNYHKYPRLTPYMNSEVEDGEIIETNSSNSGVVQSYIQSHPYISNTDMHITDYSQQQQQQQQQSQQQMTSAVVESEVSQAQSDVPSESTIVAKDNTIVEDNTMNTDSIMNSDVLNTSGEVISFFIDNSGKMVTDSVELSPSSNMPNTTATIAAIATASDTNMDTTTTTTNTTYTTATTAVIAAASDTNMDTTATTTNTTFTTVTTAVIATASDTNMDTTTNSNSNINNHMETTTESTTSDCQDHPLVS